MSPRSSIILAAALALCAAAPVPIAAARPGRHSQARHRYDRDHHRQPDLALRLSGAPGTVNTGQQVTYTATIVNTGGRRDGDAGFRDVIPRRASLVSSTASRGSCRGNRVVACRLGPLARGASATVTIVVTANRGGRTVNFGWVSTSPPRRWEHRHSVTTTVEGSSPRVGLRATTSPGTVDVGGQVTYTATIDNSGNGAAANVAFRDLLPGKASLVSANASQGSCSGNPTVVCSLGALNAGASATVTIAVTANQRGWTIDNGWVSTGSPGGPRHHFRLGIFVHPVETNLDLELSGPPGPVDSGQQVTYTATVTNSGTGPETNTAFQDLLPGKASLVSASASQGSCSGNPVVVCNLGALDAGASATITIVVTADAPGRMTDRGWVSTNPPGNWNRERSIATAVVAAPAATTDQGTTTTTTH